MLFPVKQLPNAEKVSFEARECQNYFMQTQPMTGLWAFEAGSNWKTPVEPGLGPTGAFCGFISILIVLLIYFQTTWQSCWNPSIPATYTLKKNAHWNEKRYLLSHSKKFCVTIIHNNSMLVQSYLQNTAFTIPTIENRNYKNLQVWINGDLMQSP